MNVKDSSSALRKGCSTRRSQAVLNQEHQKDFFSVPFMTSSRAYNFSALSCSPGLRLANRPLKTASYPGSFDAGIQLRWSCGILEQTIIGIRNGRTNDAILALATLTFHNSV